jgi:DNA adenine methylase
MPSFGWVFIYMKGIRMQQLKAPFPYFGGKSKVADTVWNFLGKTNFYVEPFFGSGAVLFANPYSGMEEIVNDADYYLANVWRAIKHKPQETFDYADNPINHADLHARRNFLLREWQEIKSNIIKDPEWCNPKHAGYWIYGQSCWIGSGFIPSDNETKQIADDTLGQIPTITVRCNFPAQEKPLGRVPTLDHAKGVNTHTAPIGKIPCIDHIRGVSTHNENGRDMRVIFQNLSDRLKNVRVVCGDWTRVLGGNWKTAKDKTCSIFFDPPYDTTSSTEFYANNDKSVTHDVRQWCVENGDNPSYRIVLAGYDEHNILESHGWSQHKWTANGGYQKNKQEGNRFKETLWLSPHCVKETPKQDDSFLF